jgi:hypothetical protein
VVVLPTEFVGGEDHFFHSDRTLIVSSSGKSVSDMTLLSWCPGVMHEIVGDFFFFSLLCLTDSQKLITSGYRLALLYNLVLDS